MFVVSVPILNLQSFSNSFFGEIGGEDIVSIIATNYPTIKRLRLSDDYDSSSTLLKFVECCREIEKIFFHESSGDDILYLKRSDIEAIASLPRLKSLNIENGTISMKSQKQQTPEKAERNSKSWKGWLRQ
jgi:hypothetical protein